MIGSHRKNVLLIGHSCVILSLLTKWEIMESRVGGSKWEDPQWVTIDSAKGYSPRYLLSQTGANFNILALFKMTSFSTRTNTGGTRSREIHL